MCVSGLLFQAFKKETFRIEKVYGAGYRVNSHPGGPVSDLELKVLSSAAKEDQEWASGR